MEQTVNNKFTQHKVLHQQNYIDHQSNMDVIRSLPLYSRLNLRQPQDNKMLESMLLITPLKKNDVTDKMVDIYMSTIKDSSMSRYDTKKQISKSLVDVSPNIKENVKQEKINESDAVQVYSRLYPKELTDEERKIHTPELSFTKSLRLSQIQPQFAGSRPFQRKAKYVALNSLGEQKIQFQTNSVNHSQKNIIIDQTIQRMDSINEEIKLITYE
ncbi:hypothetical protein SS50377_26822 [Spironucleus salmonicida]|uniref:Uncharacterized protein n=1 Tax=Spironucleus salmonicida TaxID=348837 RepID=V6LZV6_9EUKA|nr:hypothetical protein SS50377_26822 [Spironucleus salmonicida]|eukprot:EST49291.1 Hypothetical protein SS50377_10514 [Spironucleus salmonicida]